MFAGPAPFTWYATELSGAVRIRDFEKFLIMLTISTMDSEYIASESIMSRNFRINCKKESTGLIDHIKRRFRQYIYHGLAHRKPETKHQLEELRSFLQTTGRQTAKSMRVMTNWERYIND